MEEAKAQGKNMQGLGLVCRTRRRDKVRKKKKSSIKAWFSGLAEELGFPSGRYGSL
jgi:hypothetical protein